jgi:hypothetical protein
MVSLCCSLATNQVRRGLRRRVSRVEMRFSKVEQLMNSELQMNADRSKLVLVFGGLVAETSCHSDEESGMEGTGHDNSFPDCLITYPHLPCVFWLISWLSC